MPFERRHARPATRPVFLRRVAAHAGAATLLIGVSLALGMWGYARFEGLGWLDAFLNASMLLGGMGPVDAPRTPSGKLFAGVYALYAGLVFLVTAGIVAAPLVHRLMHRFHFREDET